MIRTVTPISRQALTQRCHQFALMGFWPDARRINAQRWLSNFHSESESDLALYLLSAFQYFSEQMCDQMFKAAFQLLASRVSASPAPYSSWKEFESVMKIAPMPGEIKNPTDSGYAYVRMAKKVLGYPEEKCVDSTHALQCAFNGYPVVFVDDFVGSGQQFITMYHAETKMRASFHQFKQAKAFSIYYCPLVATAYGLSQINRRCPGVTVLPVHVLPEEYALVSSDYSESIWPAQHHDTGVEMLKKFAREEDVDEPLGFHNLALGIAFHDCTPDATLPIFTYKSDTWKPLVTK